MKTELANYLNAQADKTKAEQRATRPEQSEQSPLPWSKEDSRSSLCPFEIVQNGRTVAYVAWRGSNTEAEANAAYIVQACNEYPKAITALERVLDVITGDQAAELGIYDILSNATT